MKLQQQIRQDIQFAISLAIADSGISEGRRQRLLAIASNTPVGVEDGKVIGASVVITETAPLSVLLGDEL